PGDGSGSGGRHNGRQTRFRPLGTDLLRRIRRPEAQAGPGKDHRRVAHPLRSMLVYHGLMGRRWGAFARCAAMLPVFAAHAQLIELESGGLKYHALTKEGLTIMV